MSEVGEVPTRLAVAVLVVSVAFGFLIGGAGTAFVAAVPVLVVGWGPVPRRLLGRPAAAAAFVLLLVAAVATVVEVWPPVLRNDFALSRPVAASAARTAGAFVASALVSFALLERRREPAPRIEAEPLGLGFAGLRREGALVAGTLLAAAVHLLTLPRLLPASLHSLVDNVRLGLGYFTGARWEAEASAVPPLPVVIAAFGPGPARLGHLAVSAASVAAVLVLVRRLGGSLAWWVVAAVATWPWLGSAALPESAAGLAVVTAVLLSWPPERRASYLFWSGALLGLAGLCRPEALVALPVLGVWLSWRTGWPGVGAVASAAMLVYVPWQAWVHREVGTWLPGELSGPVPNVPAVATVSALVATAVATEGFWRNRRRWRCWFPLAACGVLGGVMAAVGGIGLAAWTAPLVVGAAAARISQSPVGASPRKTISRSAMRQVPSGSRLNRS